MTTLTIRLSAPLPNGEQLYQETAIDRSLYSDTLLTLLYSKLAADFDAFVAAQPPA